MRHWTLPVEASSGRARQRLVIGRVYDRQTGRAAYLLGFAHGSALALAWTNTNGGGAPMSFELDVSGAVTTTLAIGFGDSFSVSGPPEVPTKVRAASLRLDAR